jgi:CPA2 family monovalent cation:H+ antiporter-2
MSTERKFLEKQVVLVGYGRVGHRIAEALERQGIPYVVAEQNRELVESLRNKGIAAVSGDASEPSVLIQAHIADAAMLVIASPDPINVRQMVDTARTLNPISKSSCAPTARLSQRCCAKTIWASFFMTRKNWPRA